MTWLGIVVWPENCDIRQYGMIQRGKLCSVHKIPRCSAADKNNVGTYKAMKESTGRRKWSNGGQELAPVTLIHYKTLEIRDTFLVSL